MVLLHPRAAPPVTNPDRAEAFARFARQDADLWRERVATARRTLEFAEAQASASEARAVQFEGIARGSPCG